MIELSELVENSVIAWIENTATHDQTIGIVPRNFKAMRFDNAGDLDPIQLPALVVQAIQDRMLHTKVAVYLFHVEITLKMEADDTNQATWNTASGGLETVFSADDLSTYLTNGVSDYLCRGILSRNLGQTMTEDRHWTRTFRLELWASRGAN